MFRFREISEKTDLERLERERKRREELELPEIDLSEEFEVEDEGKKKLNDDDILDLADISDFNFDEDENAPSAQLDNEFDKPLGMPENKNKKGWDDIFDDLDIEPNNTEKNQTQDEAPIHKTTGKLTSLFKELSEQKQEGVQPQTQVQQEDIGGQTRVQAQTQEPTQQQSHVKEPEPQPKQGPQPQMPNWEMVGVGKTEILADSKEAFKKARQDKREAAQQANKKTSPKPQAPNQEEQKLRDFAAWEKEVEEAIAKAVAEWRERTKANVSDEEKVKTEQEAQQKPQPPRTPNTSQEYSYDLNFNSSRDVHLGQNGAMKIDFSTPAPKPNVPNRQTTDMQQTVQSNGQKQPISYMKKQFFNKGGSR